MSNTKENCFSYPKIMSKKKRAEKITEQLHEMYPDADCTLEYREPFKLLISGILAAQCTDARVNIIAKDLFSIYPDPYSFACADIIDLQKIIRSCGFFNTKSKYIIESMKIVCEKYKGKIPSTREELMELPGVGRKIANLILGDCFGIPAIVVDTHCLRISKHLGLSESKNPLKTEHDLMKYLPQEEWISYGHKIVAHGRNLCIARNPKCNKCPLKCLCLTGRKSIG